MKRSNFKGLNLSFHNTRRNLDLNSFLGVDYTSSSFNVAYNRAIDILNLIYKDNVIQKRRGFKHILITNTNEKIHNIIEFNNHYVVHSGNHLYWYDKEFNFVGGLSDKKYILDKKVSFIIKNDKLFCLSGIKFFYLDKEFKYHNVEDEAYIPTTTIGITNKYNPVDYYSNGDLNRTNLDKVNNLSDLVINELVSGTRINKMTEEIEYNKKTIYQLDNKINKDKYEKIKIRIDNEIKTDVQDIAVWVVKGFTSFIEYRRREPDLENEVFVKTSNLNITTEFTSQNLHKNNFFLAFIIGNTSVPYLESTYQMSKNLYVYYPNDYNLPNDDKEHNLICRIYDGEVWLKDFAFELNKEKTVATIKDLKWETGKNIKLLPIEVSKFSFKIFNQEDEEIKQTHIIIPPGDLGPFQKFEMRKIDNVYSTGDLVSGEYKVAIYDEDMQLLLEKKVKI